MPIITIQPKNAHPQRFEVSPNRETVTIGRSSKNDVKIDCESVSGSHAIIRKLQKIHVLRDLGSTNGTKMDGKRVSEIHLKGGQNIKIGDVTLTFKPDGESDSRAAKPDQAKAKTQASGDKKPSSSKLEEKSQEDNGIEKNEKDPTRCGLALMGSGLIIVGFVVLIGIETIRAIPERGASFLVGGLALIVIGLLCLGSTLVATGRIKLPRLAIQFEDDPAESESSS